MPDDQRPLIPEGGDTDKDNQRFSLHKEVLHIGKEMIHTGQLHVRRFTVNHQVPLTETLRSLSASVEVLPVGKYVDEIPQPFNEGDILIIPVYEEHVEIVKRIYLKEEVRITTKNSEQIFKEQVEAREQLLTVSRNEK